MRMDRRLHKRRIATASFVFVLQRDEQGRFLVIEEQKPKSGWYVPAGHVEDGESIADAAKREAKEESGSAISKNNGLPYSLKRRLDFEVGELVFIQKDPYMIRFFVSGKVTGGRLKTPDVQDAESIQAAWVSLLDFQENYQLRSPEILSIMKAFEADSFPKVPWKGLPFPTVQQGGSWRCTTLFVAIPFEETIVQGDASPITFLPTKVVMSPEEDRSDELKRSIRTSLMEDERFQSLQAVPLEPLLLDVQVGRYQREKMGCDAIFLLPLIIESKRAVQHCRLQEGVVKQLDNYNKRSRQDLERAFYVKAKESIGLTDDSGPEDREERVSSTALRCARVLMAFLDSAAAFHEIAAKVSSRRETPTLSFSSIAERGSPLNDTIRSAIKDATKHSIFLQ